MINKIQVYICRDDQPLPRSSRVLEYAGIYSKATGIKMTNDEIIITEKGKPCFKNGGIFFSISHSGEYWVCVFHDDPVGVDIQEVRKINAPAVSKRFFNRREALWLEANNYNDFFNVWTAKESYVKYTGEGITDNFKDFSVIHPAEDKFFNEKAVFRHLSFKEDYSLCVCAANINEIEIIEII